MERAELKQFFHKAHQAAWNLIKKLPEAFKRWSADMGQSLAETLKIDSHSLATKATTGLLTLAALFGGQKMNAQNYQVGQTVKLPGGFTGTIVKSPTKAPSPTISYQQAAQRSSSGYGHVQSPLAAAQNTIINNNLVIDAQMTANLDLDRYAYACCRVSPEGHIQRDQICLVGKDGHITQNDVSRGQCFSEQTGGVYPWGCTPGRNIGLQEASDLAFMGIPMINHTNTTKQAYNSAKIDNALGDGAVYSPREEAIMWQQEGFHYNRDLSNGTNRDVYQILTRGRNEAVVIYREPKIDEQTGEVSCVERTTQGYLKAQKSGNAYPYNAPVRNYQRGWGRGGRW